MTVFYCARLLRTKGSETKFLDYYFSRFSRETALRHIAYRYPKWRLLSLRRAVPALPFSP